MSKSQLQIEYSSQRSIQKVKDERDMLWFNVDTGEMEKFRGSRLLFGSDGHPVAVTDEIPVSITTTNKEDIQKWISDIGIHFEIEVIDDNPYGIVIRFEDKFSSVIEYALDRFGIRYSVA